jgi:hypothetical protein
VVSSANDGNSFDQVERTVFQALKKIGFGAMALLIKLQGDGDLGHKITSADRSLSKNPNPSVTRIRSIFGEHSFQECTYGTGKHTTAHFASSYEDGEKDVTVSALLEGTSWLAQQVEARRSPNQTVILLMDGQEGLWDAARTCLEGAAVVEILDIIHVSSYVWEAASLFESTQDNRMAFARKRLQLILKGCVSSVLKGLRRLGTSKGLMGDKLKSLNTICGYLEKHKLRMRYDEYLMAGYPIAAGVIEGACRHLVKDRMERSGMRWTLEGTRSRLINDYRPLSLAC